MHLIVVMVSKKKMFCSNAQYLKYAVDFSSHAALPPLGGSIK